VRFWDASALVPLVVQEKGSALVKGWLREDADVILWGLTRLELASAVERRAREGLLKARERVQALDRVERIASDAHEVSDLAAVRVRGVALLARHPLRAADVAQLGAALLVADPDPSSLAMVVLDQRLATAAAREGLRVLTWPDP
jgi:predicted nucleic acid-binding protein